jgi:hypothetical protein
MFLRPSFISNFKEQAVNQQTVLGRSLRKYLNSSSNFYSSNLPWMMKREL